MSHFRPEHEQSAIRWLDVAMDLERVAPLVKAFALSVDQDIRSTWEELINSVGTHEHKIVVGVDTDTDALIGYALARLVVNYNDPVIYISHIYAQRPMVGRQMFNFIAQWGKQQGWKGIIGFVQMDKVEASSRLWQAYPWRVALRKDL